MYELGNDYLYCQNSLLSVELQNGEYIYAEFDISFQSLTFRLVLKVIITSAVRILLENSSLMYKMCPFIIFTLVFQRLTGLVV